MSDDEFDFSSLTYDNSDDNDPEKKTNAIGLDPFGNFIELGDDDGPTDLY